MKKTILGIILILLSHQAIFGMEESIENKINILSELGKHHPELQKKVEELQMNVIEEGIISAFESGLKSPESYYDPAKAVINAYKYINTITSIDRSWYFKKAELIGMLKDLAEELFAYNYADLNQEELNDLLADNLFDLMKTAHGIGLEEIRKQMSQNKILVEDNRTNIARLIIAGADPNFETSVTGGYSAISSRGLLQIMIELEDIDLVLLLIIYGANVNRKDSNFITPLRAAIAVPGDYPHSDMHKVEKIIKLLILHGANFNMRDEHGGYSVINSAIRIASSKQDVLLEILLKNGLKLEEEDVSYIKFFIAHREPNIYDNIVNILKKYGY